MSDKRKKITNKDKAKYHAQVKLALKKIKSK